MNKTPQQLGLEAKEKYRKIFESIENAKKQAKKFVYKSLDGTELSQEPGHYNTRIAVKITQDMYIFACADRNIKDKNIKEKMCTWPDRMTNLNLNIRRMNDDYKDLRPIIDYDFKDTYDMMEEIKELTKIDDIRDSRLFEMSKIWAEFLYQMYIWAFALKQKGIIRKHRIQINNETEKENADAIENMCKLRNILAEDMTLVPPLSDELSMIVDQLKILDMICQTILDGTFEEVFNDIED